jgi:hypothetical protein
MDKKMDKRFSSKMKEFQVFVIIVVAIGEVLFSGSTLRGDLPMTPQEAVDLVSGYNDREEMLDAQLANPALQGRENFWGFAYNMAGRDLESNQSFTNAVMNAVLSSDPILICDIK